MLGFKCDRARIRTWDLLIRRYISKSSLKPIIYGFTQIIYKINPQYFRSLPTYFKK
jgi:hypothetical protein